MDLSELSAEARKLSEADRLALIEDLLTSFDVESPEIEQLWVEEAKDRLAAYRRGELQAKPLGEILEKYGRR